MSYTKTTWRNNQAPAINADNLNHMEQGIESAHNQIDVNTSNIESLTTQVQNNATNIASEISARQTTDSSLQSQIDQLVAPTGEAPNPAEIENARIGDDGVTYDTLGNAIRTQFSDVKSVLTSETNARVLLANRVTTAETDINTLEAHKVAQPLDENNQPTDGTSGQSLRTNGDGTTEWADVGLPTDAQTAQAVSDWLDEHPEATTTVQDHSLTYEKLVIGTLGYATPEMFGAKGDGVTDDTNAFKSALQSGNPIFGMSGSKYLITQPITIQDQSAKIFIDNCEVVCNIASNYLFNFNVNEIHLTNMLFDGDNACYGVLSATSFADCIICNNCIIERMGAYLDGIFPTTNALCITANYGSLTDCIARNNGGHGLMVYADNANNPNAQYSISGCKAITNGDSLTATAIGIGSYSPTNNAKCAITNCIAIGNGASGIAPHGINNVAISNCIAHDNGEHGIVIQQSNDSIVSGCEIKGNSFAGIRVQGDFSLPSADRFVNNVLVTGNRINQYYPIYVGVKATNIVADDNTIINCKVPILIDNGANGRNVGSSNVLYINNKIHHYSYDNVTYADYFNGFILKNNRYLYDGSLYPDGFHRHTNGAFSLFMSWGDCTDKISPSNTKAIAYGDFASGASSWTNGVLTLSSNISAGANIGELSALISDALTIHFTLPNGIVPSFRARTSGGSMVADSSISSYSYTASNGYINNFTVTFINKDPSNVAKICILLAAQSAINAGAYNVSCEAADGYRLHKA